MRIDNVFEHQPGLFYAFNRVYGTLWTLGEVDQATKEVGRIRNARQVGCQICMNLRFAGAREQGLSEDMVAAVDDGYDGSELPARQKLAVRVTDVLLADPAGMPAELRDELISEFGASGMVELMLTIALASGFSKAAVAWGPPEPVPTTVVPTPTPRPEDRYR